MSDIWLKSSFIKEEVRLEDSRLTDEVDIGPSIIKTEIELEQSEVE